MDNIRPDGRCLPANLAEASLATSSTATANDYVELKRLITAEGLLKPNYPYYIMKTVSALALLAITVGAVMMAHDWFTVIAASVFLGFTSTQVALLAHDIGHRQAFRGRKQNAVARVLVGNVVLGVSHTWWNTKHNQHHATPNHVDKDPDIQFPMLAFSAEQVASRPRIFRSLIRAQAYLLAVLMPFQAVNMRLNSLGTIRAIGLRRAWPEALGIIAHVALYAVLLALLDSWVMALTFAVVHHAVFGVYNSTVFASNHKGMPLIKEGERLDFFREQVITSRNINRHPITDFWYGGLNYQIEHHLFPNMPRCNLSKAQVIIRDFCASKGVEYHSASVVETYREVFGHLNEVGKAPRLPERETASASQ